MQPMTRSPPPHRADFGCFRPIGTRWLDNDAYGHINNVVYYAYFDTVVNAYLIERAGCDIRQLPAIGVVAETGCRFFSSLSFPQQLEIGLSIDRLGRSSISYRLGVFAEGADIASAEGLFVHVYVDRSTREVVPVPSAILEAVQSLVR